jgi:PhoH-like ATPase
VCYDTTENKARELISCLLFFGFSVRKKAMQQKTKKIYVLDTNVLLSDGNAITSFQENDVVIPFIVVEELDKHKTRQDEAGKEARETVRKLDGLMKQHPTKDPKDGIPINDLGGRLFILSLRNLSVTETNLAFRTDPDVLKGNADNIILEFCLALQGKNPETACVLVSQDILLNVKAKQMGIAVEPYKKIKATDTADQIFSGCLHLAEEFYDINKLYTNPISVLDYVGDNKLYPNQFIVIKNTITNQSAVLRCGGKPYDHIRLAGDSLSAGKLKAKNKEQNFALDLLTDDSVKLVSLIGTAGTGKTLCAIAAGYEQVLGGSRNFKSLLVSRPVHPMGKDIGFLPGDINEKMEPWIAPIKDNLRFLIGDGTKSKSTEETLNHLMDKGLIEIEVIAFIRGRSIPKAFIIIDEAQNLSGHELKTIITRCGEDSKIVLTGDIEQIDNLSVDATTNALTIAVEKFKDSPLAGHVTLTKGERSLLATEAAKIL